MFSRKANPCFHHLITCITQFQYEVHPRSFMVIHCHSVGLCLTFSGRHIELICCTVGFTIRRFQFRFLKVLDPCGALSLESSTLNWMKLKLKWSLQSEEFRVCDVFSPCILSLFPPFRSPPKFHILSKSSTWAWMHCLNLPLWQAKYTMIYCLCNNAGIMARPDEATVDGYDTQMQTNHLSHFLLLLGPSCWHWFCWIQKKTVERWWYDLNWKNMKKWYVHGCFLWCFWDKQMEFVQWCHWCHWALVHPMAQSLEGSWEKWVNMVGISDISYIYI